MRRIRSRGDRILAVDPFSRGFGFVVLEGPEKLVDWGLRDVRRDKDAVTIAKVRELIALYRPAVLATEDCSDPRSLRREHARQLIDEILNAGKAIHVRTHAVPVARVRAVFGATGATTKHAIAGILAARFPELARHRPPRRKPWMSEDERQAMFDALAFGLSHLRAKSI
jgi:hypothetical protein